MGSAFIGPTRNNTLVSFAGSPLKHVGGAFCREVPSLGHLCDTFGSIFFFRRLGSASLSCFHFMCSIFDLRLPRSFHVVFVTVARRHYSVKMSVLFLEWLRQHFGESRSFFASHGSPNFSLSSISVCTHCFCAPPSFLLKQTNKVLQQNVQAQQDVARFGHPCWLKHLERAHDASPIAHCGECS